MQGIKYLLTITHREFSEQYIDSLKKNGINFVTATLCQGTAKDNVLDFVDNSDTAITFEHKMMCKKTYDVGKTRYLFKVKEVPLFLMDGDDFTDIKDPSLTYAYYQIDLDGNTSTYNVKPISEKAYGDDCHE
jgi:hypothetical protein